MQECPWIACVGLIFFGDEDCFWSGCLLSLSSACAAHYPRQGMCSCVTLTHSQGGRGTQSCDPRWWRQFMSTSGVQDGSGDTCSHPWTCGSGALPLESGHMEKEAPLAVPALSSCCCCCSVAQSCPILCDPMDCSTPGFLVLHHLPELVRTLVHCICDAIHSSHPLASPFPPAFNLSQHQDLF